MPFVGHAFATCTGYGILLEPVGSVKANVVALGDADTTPEALAGIADGLSDDQQFARRLAERGCRVVIPYLVNRTVEPRLGRAKMTHREYVYRSAYNLGRHILGYEIQKVFGVIDWFHHTQQDLPIGIIGWGEGGLISLHAGALDTRIGSVCTSGYFCEQADRWKNPLSRNVFGIAEKFGDAELAYMVSPRTLVIGSVWQVRGIPWNLIKAGAPSVLDSPSLDSVKREYERTKNIARHHDSRWQPTFIESAEGAGAFGSSKAIAAFANRLELESASTEEAAWKRGDCPLIPTEERQKRLVEDMVDQNQWLLEQSRFVREAFMKDLKTNSLKEFEGSVEAYRKKFREDVIGHFADPLLPPNARTRTYLRIG